MLWRWVIALCVCSFRGGGKNNLALLSGQQRVLILLKDRLSFHSFMYSPSPSTLKEFKAICSATKTSKTGFTWNHYGIHKNGHKYLKKRQVHNERLQFSFFLAQVTVNLGDGHEGLTMVVLWAYPIPYLFVLSGQNPFAHSIFLKQASLSRCLMYTPLPFAAVPNAINQTSLARQGARQAS